MSSLLRRPTGAVPAAESEADLRVLDLDDSDRADLIELVDSDPIVNAVLSARIAALPTVSGRRFGGALIGVRDDRDQLTAAVFNGGNLLPIGGGDRELSLLGRHLARERRVCSSIVGPAASTRLLWAQLAPAWGSCRAVRTAQPLLVLDAERSGPAGDRRVRQVVSREVDAYVPAAAAMFTEELGISPYACAASADYRRRVTGLIREGRAFAIFDSEGQVVFKADLGAISRHTCQVQGVWVRPDRRGLGIGTAALAAVIDHALTLAPTVSLYVNDFNTSARRMYDTLGMRQIETLATVLF